MLTVIRGLAAWWIVLFHFKDHFPSEIRGTALFSIISHGSLAVDLFFVLSGFVIALNYSNDFKFPAWAQYMRFLALRLARIYPLHFFMMLIFLVNPISIFLWSSSGLSGDRYSVHYYLLSILLVQNWGLTQTLAWNIPAWSISTEWAAYLLFPINIALTIRLANTAFRRGLLVVTLLLLLAAICYLLNYTLAGDIAKFGLVRCLLEFSIGVALQQMWESYERRRAWRGYVAIATSAILIMVFATTSAPDFIIFPLLFCCIIFFSATIRWAPKFSVSLIFVWIGEISYSTYMVHYFVKDWVKFLFIHSETEATAIPMIIYLVVVMISSLILYHLIEVPGRRAIRGMLNNTKRQTA